MNPTVDIIQLPAVFSEELEAATEETTETTETDIPTSSIADTGIILGVFLAPFFIIIFLISVILVLSLKKG